MWPRRLSPRGMPVKEKRDDRADNYSQKQKAENREEHTDRRSYDRVSSRKFPKYEREDKPQRRNPGIAQDMKLPSMCKK